jgi:hypothetical protein
MTAAGLLGRMTGRGFLRLQPAARQGERPMKDIPGYVPSEEHELLRQAVRELAEAKIARPWRTWTRPASFRRRRSTR